jgi:hypothetical protein
MQKLSMKWGRCKKFGDYSDYCRKDKLRCGWVGKYFIHKKYGNSSSNTGFLDTYFTYADLMIYNKTLDGNETERNETERNETEINETKKM